MRMFRFKFYKIEISKEGEEEARHYLGFVDINNEPLADGCSLYAKAFRLCSMQQKTANAVDVQEL